ncbi:CarD family transcriptional regulator [uncultured Oscillibacter sp.]|uniref:CarD family transcriptional regulator n=1 Tax=uncultured Oscillibacter sp. TaxID=876091 RepID=UPI0025E5C5A6|nr:CarD family transcriptional regulator [uncultured Oscillibacter sp.]
MYQVGDLVFYGSIGVCEITGIISRTVEFRRHLKFYVFKPLYCLNYIILVPVDIRKVFMRPIISSSEANRLLDLIPTIGAKAYYNRKLNQLTEHYEAFLKTHECLDLIKLTISIYDKKRIADHKQQKFGSVDEKYMKRGEDLLFGELAAALEISKNKAAEYVAARLKLDQRIS